jgi:IstB-like ATP binding protein
VKLLYLACRYLLLVIDEVGYILFEPEAVNLFFHVSNRYERASVIVTSATVRLLGRSLRRRSGRRSHDRIPTATNEGFRSGSSRHHIAYGGDDLSACPTPRVVVAPLVRGSRTLCV